MALFKKRETLVQNIAYMAIMAAINVIFVLLTAILPPLMFLIVFVLPLTSTVVTLFCKKKYFPIYFIVTIGLCLAVTSGIYIFDTFFYVIPSLITGFVFGLLIEKKVPAIYILTASSVLQYALMFLTFITLNAIVSEINFIDALLSMFGMSSFAFKDAFVHSFLFVLASIQTIFTYIILKTEIKKLGFEINLYIGNKLIPLFINLFFIIFAVIFVFIYHPLTFVAILAAIPLNLYLFASLMLEKNKLVYILSGIAIVISLSLFIGFYTFLPHPLGIILIAPLYVLISCLYFANYLFINKTKPAKIDN